MRAVCTVKLKFLVIILPHESSVYCVRKLFMETEDRSRDQPTMEKTFAQNHFTMMDHFTMIDRSHDQSTIEKTFAKRSCDLSTIEKTFAKRSHDLSTIEKTFAQGKIMHLQRDFHYGDFINATIRECPFQT